MNNALHQKELIDFLKTNPPITTNDFLNFYRQFNPDMPVNTLRWRIHELKQQGIIYSPKRGIYTLKEKESFYPVISPKMSTLAELLAKRFPSVRFSIYAAQWIGNLSNHVYQTNNLVVEIDIDVLDAAFYLLKEQFPNTFISPEQKMYDYYILPQEENIIVNRLHVDAPLSKVKANFYTPKLEKLIVDLLINEPVILPIGTSEIELIVANALDNYAINYSALGRYATKRNVKEQLDKLLSGGLKENDPKGKLY